MTILSKFSHVLVLGRGGFGAELGEMLEDCGWGKPVAIMSTRRCAASARPRLWPWAITRCACS